jgi:hypothetical protein
VAVLAGKEPTEDELARLAVIPHFEASTGKQTIDDMSWVVGHRPNENIVHLCEDGNSIPPERRWFSVPSTSEDRIRELTLEETAEFEETKWR